ncbi:MAG: hypothetical protein U1A27_12880 [Phycisphaerae bacterium]
MTRRTGLFLGVALELVGALAAPAFAGGRTDLTWLPCNARRFPKGQSIITFPLAPGLDGVVRSPMVLLGLYAPVTDPNAKQPPAVFSATVKMKVGERVLTPWTVFQKTGTAYVLSVETQEAGPKFKEAEPGVEVTFDVENNSGGEVFVWAMASPDPLLLGKSLDGPLEQFRDQASDPFLKSLLSGLVEQFAGHREPAKKLFNEACKSPDERIADAARRSRRMMMVLDRTSDEVRKASFAERYRWALYYMACGFYQLALSEFDGAVELDRTYGPAWFHLGELMERCNYKRDMVDHQMLQAAKNADVLDPTVWNVLVTFVRKRTVEVEENGTKTTRTLTLSDDEIKHFKDSWVAVQKTIVGATRGLLEPRAAFYVIEDTGKRKLTTYGDGVVAPAEDLLEVRGWFDSVISVRPHLPNEGNRTAGGDVGPKGAVVSDVAIGADWQDLLEVVLRQFEWSILVGERATDQPFVDGAVGCGIMPIRSRGFGLRAFMRYCLTPAIFRHVKAVPTVEPAGARKRSPTTRAAEEAAATEPVYLRYWRVWGPQPAAASGPAPIADATSAGRLVLDSATPFIDLRGVLKESGSQSANAICWVKSPDRRHVQMWLGRNGPLHVWVNGLTAYEGRYPLAGRYGHDDRVDIIPSAATLEAGWNRLEVASQSDGPNGWGFSVRMTQFDGTPVNDLRFSTHVPDAGLAPAVAPPQPGNWFNWLICQPAYHELTPRLSAADLAKLTGLREVALRGSVAGAGGFFAIDVAGRAESPSYHKAPASGSTEVRDTRLNNVLDWTREDTCAIRFEKDGVARDLLFMKPEAVEPYLTLLREPPSAASIFGSLVPANRVVGYVLVPSERPSGRVLIVADVQLSADKDPWPLDEEDLLDPRLK